MRLAWFYVVIKILMFASTPGTMDKTQISTYLFGKFDFNSTFKEKFSWYLFSLYWFKFLFKVVQVHL